MPGRSLATLICLLVAGCLTPKPREASPPPAAARPTTHARAVAEVLVGTFRGTVFDGEQQSAVVTRFERTDAGTLVGSYTIDEGREQYTGELREYVEVWPEMFWCRFTWSDKHGTGILSVMAAPDGSGFGGFWGDEIADPRLKWTGTRDAEASATRPAP